MMTQNDPTTISVTQSYSMSKYSSDNNMKFLFHKNNINSVVVFVSPENNVFFTVFYLNIKITFK